jgi:hypothetical protein
MEFLYKGIANFLPAGAFGKDLVAHKNLKIKQVLNCYLMITKHMVSAAL